jgi:hypothetical protein
MTMSSIGQGGNIGAVRGGYSDVPTILRSFGVGQYNLPMAMQYAFMIPRSTDPDAQGVILMVEAVQRGLQMLGASVQVSGILDQTTVNYLRRVSGLSWHGKTWVQILGDLSSAIQRRMTLRPQGLSGYTSVSGIEVSTGAAAFFAIGAYFVYKAIRGRKSCTTS